MEKARALQVLSVLAQGMDPVSGKSLPEDGPYNTPETIRALHLAMDSLLWFVSDGWRPKENLTSRPDPFQAEEEEETRKRSRQAWADDFPEMDAAQQRLFEKLKQWRNEQAKTENVPGYLVFSNATLARVAHDYPETMDELAKIKGIGDVKMERYSDVVLDMVNDFLEAEEANSCRIASNKEPVRQAPLNILPLGIQQRSKLKN